VGERHKLEWLELGRGLAAMAVVFSHARFYLVETPAGLHFVDRWGNWGVTFFFVLRVRPETSGRIA
jgi:peptidoglycan/LPS O-acetylase OafA/YrhL